MKNFLFRKDEIKLKLFTAIDGEKMLYSKKFLHLSVFLFLLILASCWGGRKPQDVSIEEKETVLAKKEVVIEIKNLEQFDSIFKEKPVVAKFYATWCMPCKMMIPIFEALAEKHYNEISFVKIDVDNRELAAIVAQYVTRGVPAFVFFDKNKNAIQILVGGKSKETLEKTILKLL